MASVVPEFTVVGCGPGAREYMTPRASACVAQAELLAGSPRLLELFADSRAHKLPYNGISEAWLDRLEATPARPCVVLVSGDPGISSLSRVVLRRFGSRRCRVEPGISSVQVACSVFGLSWQNASVVDCHSSTAQAEECPPDKRDPWIFLMGSKGAEAQVANLIRTSQRYAYLAEDLSLPNERTFAVSADELATLSAHPRRLVILSREKLLDD